MGIICLPAAIPKPHSVLVLGGSFDPVHKGHVALAHRFIDLLRPQELRLIPAAQPWQKSALVASAQDRVAMLKLAFAELAIPLVVDQQELEQARQGKTTYSIDTLRRLRAELGPNCTISFLVGADQLQNLTTWRDWQHLFDLAHLCAATRPGSDAYRLPGELDTAWRSRLGMLDQLRNTPAGYTFLATDLSEDVSATQIRRQLVQNAEQKVAEQTDEATKTATMANAQASNFSDVVRNLVPPKVLDYIQQHHLYR